jgi:hypothetical protein
MPVAAAATIGDLRIVRGCGDRVARARAERRDRVASGRSTSSRARARSVVAHERRARARPPCALRAGARAALVGSGHRARQSLASAARAARWSSAIPRSRSKGSSHTSSTSARRGASGRGCRSSSRRGAVARGRFRPRTSDSARAPRAGPRATRRDRRRARRARGSSAVAPRVPARRHPLRSRRRRARGLERFYDEAASAGLLPARGSASSTTTVAALAAAPRRSTLFFRAPPKASA